MFEHRPMWGYIGPGIGVSVLATPFVVAFAVDYAGNSSQYARGIGLETPVLLGVTGFGHMAIGAYLIVRGGVGHVTTEHHRRLRQGRHTLRGFLVPGIAATVIGAAAMPWFVIFAVAGGATKHCVLLQSGAGGGCSSSSSGLDAPTVLLGATALGHLALGIPFIIRGAIGERIGADGKPVAAIEPLVGPGQLGVRGTF